MAASSRFGGWRVGFPIRDTGRTGLNAGSFVVEVPTQTVSPGDEITVILYPAPGTPGVSARRIPLKRVKKVDGFTIKQKVARSRVLSDGSLEIHVVAPAECGCTLTGLVDPAPPQ